MTDIAEINLAFRAKKYGEVEPLLRYFVEHGLRDPDARRLVACLARGKSLRASGKPVTEAAAHRDEFIRVLVAHEAGILAGSGRDPRRAFGIVAKRTQQSGDGLSTKQIKRIWESRQNSATLRMLFTTGRMIGFSEKNPDINSRG